MADRSSRVAEFLTGGDDNEEGPIFERIIAGMHGAEIQNALLVLFRERLKIDWLFIILFVVL